MSITLPRSARCAPQSV